MNRTQQIITLAGALALAVILLTGAFTRSWDSHLTLTLAGEGIAPPGRDASGMWRASGIIVAATVAGVVIAGRLRLRNP